MLCVSYYHTIIIRRGWRGSIQCSEERWKRSKSVCTNIRCHQTQPWDEKGHPNWIEITSVGDGRASGRASNPFHRENPRDFRAARIRGKVHMFRQNVISKMREQQARKKRQEDARTPSPQKGVRFRPATVGGLRKNQSPSSGIPSSPVLGAPLQSSPSSSADVVALDHTHSTADNGMMYD